jgi:outer membrane lipoprotein-sorting protein|tara:strand:+ start:66 stop:371 length:306 start_codon:yes stop_codon:yes gene_type:complete
MKIFKTVFCLSLILILFSGCQTIKKKSDEVAERENEKFGLFVGKNVNEMRIELGSPKEDYISENGNEILVYKTKKYGIPCERKFEVNSSGTIVAFSSSGCI